MRTYDSTTTPDPDRRLVGIARFEVATEGETLVAYGLGAGVAVVLFDEASGVGGLAHTMLPGGPDRPGTPGKYAQSEVRETLQEMVEAGATYGGVTARLVGGADIFHLESLGRGMGLQTVAAARDQLDALGVPVVADAVGGDRGRSVEFDTATGNLLVSTAQGETEQL